MVLSGPVGCMRVFSDVEAYMLCYITRHYSKMEAGGWGIGTESYRCNTRKGLWCHSESCLSRELYTEAICIGDGIGE